MLAGLSTAPQYLVNTSEFFERDCLVSNDVDSVILPINACGGDGALAFASNQRNKVHILCTNMFPFISSM